MTSFVLHSGERVTIEEDDQDVELIVEGEAHLVLSFEDVGAFLRALLDLELEAG